MVGAEAATFLPLTHVPEGSGACFCASRNETGNKAEYEAVGRDSLGPGIAAPKRMRPHTCFQHMVSRRET